MFWIELYLILQISIWIVIRLGLDFSVGEKNALVVLLGLGIKSFLLFIFIVLGFSRFIEFPIILSVVLYILLYTLNKIRPLAFEGSWFREFEGKGLLQYSGFWILFVLFILGVLNTWFVPITGADGIWHHVKGMVYSLPKVDFESEQIISQFRQYPPLIGLLYGWLISSGFERVSIIFPVLYLCLLFIFYHRSFEHFKSSMLAGLATLILGTTPYLWWHSFLPFLDWTAGVFYAIGVLYWFLLIKKILEPSTSNEATNKKSLAILSGIFFGIASWARPEFILFSVAPLFLLICVFDSQKQFISERNPIVARFSICALALPSLWFIVLLNFNGPLDDTFKKLIIGCSFLWIGLGLVLFRIIHFTQRIAIQVIVFLILVFLAGIIILPSPTFSPWTTLAVRIFRLFSVHIFFMGTILLIVFLFSKKLRQLSPSEKNLGTLLVLFFMTQFFIYAYSGLKWPTLSNYFENTFLYPGNSVNLSDARASMAIYPTFVFLIFCSQTIKQGIGYGRVRQFLLLIVGINLITIVTVFAGPRIKYINDNLSNPYEKRTEKSGPFDLPNQFALTYQFAHQLKNHVVNGQVLLLPPENRAGLFRSVITQVLFPNKLVFANNSYLWKNLIKNEHSQYTVVERVQEMKLCDEAKSVVLGKTGFIFCQVEKIPFNYLE
jgi:hypothetical protein